MISSPDSNDLPTAAGVKGHEYRVGLSMAAIKQPTRSQMGGKRMNPGIRWIHLLVLLLPLTGCFWDDSPTQPTRAPRNTFTDYQHIGGLVNGVWTKEHNPYVLTGETVIQDGDSLVIEAGVEIVANTTIHLDRFCKLVINGVANSPVRYVHNNPIIGGGVLGGSGSILAKYTIFEGNGKFITIGLNAQVDHCTFSEIRLDFVNFESDQYDSTIVRNCIFAGYRTWVDRLGGAQFSTYDNYTLDSAKTRIENNLFYTGIGDSAWAIDPPAIVDVLLKGQAGIRHIKGRQWPGSGNLFGNPKWVKYNYVGPSPPGISENDYHLQPGSPAIGAATDGTNIGVY